MFQDEARFGRITDPRRCWAPAGMRPQVKKQIVREYTYLYGAFCPENGTADTMILPFMDTPCMQIFLDEVASRHTDELILIVTDGAPCHTGQYLQCPNNMVILKLPPYSPECNPSENMWDDMREKWFPNITFDSMDALEDHLVQCARAYEASPKVVQSITGWDWILKPIHSFLNAV